MTVTSPSNGAMFMAPANIIIAADAADSDGSVARVDFFANGSLIGTDTTAPYSVVWGTSAAASSTLTAQAVDSAGTSTTSTPVTITVQPPNTPPTVTLTSPLNNATFRAPVTITIKANAADNNGAVARVDFLVNGSLVGTDTTAPYSVAWSTSKHATYTLTARAVDNAGASKTAAPVSVTVRRRYGSSSP